MIGLEHGLDLLVEIVLLLEHVLVQHIGEDGGLDVELVVVGFCPEIVFFVFHHLNKVVVGVDIVRGDESRAGREQRTGGGIDMELSLDFGQWIPLATVTLLGGLVESLCSQRKKKKGTSAAAQLHFTGN